MYAWSMHTMSEPRSYLSAFGRDILGLVDALLSYADDEFTLQYVAGMDMSQYRGECEMRLSLHSRVEYTGDPVDAWAVFMDANTRAVRACDRDCESERAEARAAPPYTRVAFSCAEIYAIGAKLWLRDGLDLTTPMHTHVVAQRARRRQCARVQRAIEYDVPELLSAAEIYALGGVYTGAFAESPRLRVFETLLRGQIPHTLMVPDAPVPSAGIPRWDPRAHAHVWARPQTRARASADARAWMCTRDGYTPLMIAASCSTFPYNKLVLGDINARDAHGRTALHHACLVPDNPRNDATFNARRLLERPDVDTHLRDAYGNTAFAYMVTNGSHSRVLVIAEFTRVGHDFSECATICEGPGFTAFTAPLTLFAAGSHAPGCLQDPFTMQLHPEVDIAATDSNGRTFTDYIRMLPRRTDDHDLSWRQRCDIAHTCGWPALDVAEMTVERFELDYRQMPIVPGYDLFLVPTIAHAAIAKAMDDSCIVRYTVGINVETHAQGWFRQ